jgi:hypothetical protein
MYILINVFKNLAAGRGVGQQLVSRTSDTSQKLRRYVAPASDIESSVSQLVARYNALSLAIDTALDDLTNRLSTSTSYQTCKEEVTKWLTDAEKDMVDMLLKPEMKLETGVYLERLHQLLKVLERGRGGLDELGKLEQRCQIKSALQTYSSSCSKYESLTKKLKVILAARLNIFVDCESVKYDHF